MKIDQSFIADGEYTVLDKTLRQMHVVGICGKPGSGKDTIGSFLVKHFEFCNMTLKQPIEAVVKAVFGVDDVYLYDREKREMPLGEWSGWTVRKALQHVGQSMRDSFGEDVWGKNLCKRMESLMRDNHVHRFVVTDIRTPEDVKTLRTYVDGNKGKFTLVMVKRDGFTATTSGGFANHKLESYDLESECNFIIENQGTIDDLHCKIMTIAAKVIT